MLKRNIQIRQNFAFCHQFHHLINLRIGVNIMQTDPHSEFTQFARQIDETCLDRLTLIGKVDLVAAVNTVGRSVLANDHEFTHARLS